jgi:hypothetical protein
MRYADEDRAGGRNTLTRDADRDRCNANLTVRVELLNDEGERLFRFGEGATVEDAVNDAEDQARQETQDDTYCMTEWEAAS